MDADHTARSAAGIRLLGLEDAEAYRALLEHLIGTSGRDGNPVHSPFDDPADWDGSSVVERSESRWTTAVGERGWARVLGVFVDGQLMGHATLKERWPLKASAHRADFSMGLHTSIQRLGHGRRVLDAAVAFAKSQPGLRWLDLGVFSTNRRAMALYRRAGFVETGRTPDCFRLFGESVEDVSMSLDLELQR